MVPTNAPPHAWQRDGLRFIAFGLLNTALTYGIYCLLVFVLAPQLAYFIVYVLGVMFAYIGNAKWVFKGNVSAKSAMAYPFMQMGQYLITAGVLQLMLQMFALEKRIALAVAIVIVAPLAFLMNRYLFRVREAP